HMFTTGMPNISLAFFSAASQAVALPTGIQIFALLATLLVGKLVRSVPMLFVLGALAIFVLGGLSGVMVAMVLFDFQAPDDYFVVAHLHYVLIGGVVFPIIAGLYSFYPLSAGRLMGERAGRLGLSLMFARFSISFLPMHLPGWTVRPRRVFPY